MKKKIGILASHPIEYQGPLFTQLAQEKDIDIVVFFCWDFGVVNSYDPEFGKWLKWDIPLLKGYRYTFLKNISPRPTSTNFWGEINPGIITEIKKEKLDFLIVHGWNLATTWLAFFSAFLFGVKILLRGDNPLAQEAQKPKLKLFLKKLILRPLFRRVEGFLCVGEENKKFYKYYGAEDRKLFFVPHAVDNDSFKSAYHTFGSHREEMRKKLLGIYNKNPAILFVGKFIQKKRPLDLLKSYSLVVKQFSPGLEPALIFVGDGILYETLKKYVVEEGLKNVYFVGFKNQTEISHYYALADIFVLPSEAGETWGLVVNEAMCFGLPPIVSNIVGCGPDLVRDGENGFIFPVGDIKKLSECITILSKNSKQRKIFSERSFALIDKYSYKEDIKGIFEAMKMEHV